MRERESERSGNLPMVTKERRGLNPDLSDPKALAPFLLLDETNRRHTLGAVPTMRESSGIRVAFLSVPICLLHVPVIKHI